MKHDLLKFIFSLLIIGQTNAFATLEGIPQNYVIQGHSRTCCNFVSGFLTHDVLSVFNLVAIEDLKLHKFGGDKKENEGIIYTCKAGFIDTSHLRDNIDWTGHIISMLPEMIGSEKEFPIKKEYVHRTLFMKKLEIDGLIDMSDEDYTLLAQSISYDLSVWHEILTGMGISSFDPLNIMREEMSAFSPEDNYSNLLGTFIGAAAALSPLPFNQAANELLIQKLQELKAVPKAQSRKAHRSVKYRWWKWGFMQIPDVHQVIRRHMGAYAEPVTPFRIPNPSLAGCELEEPISPLHIPRFTTKGIPLQDFYEVRVPVTGRIKKFVSKHTKNVPEYLTQKDFQFWIDVIHGQYLKMFGEKFDFE